MAHPMSSEDEYAEREGTWAAVVFKVLGSRRSFVGWTAGFVTTDPSCRTFIGATDCGALQAERSGIFWSMTWALGLPPGQTVRLYADSQSACFGSTGQWAFGLTDPLACRCRHTMLLVNEKHHLTAEHVKSHSAQPQNELVDGIAGSLATSRHVLSFKNTVADRTIAAFQGYETMWLHLVSGVLVPPIYEDKLLLPAVDEDPTFVPTLACPRDLQWTTTTTTQTAKLDFSVATYNVLSLRHCDPILVMLTRILFSQAKPST